MTHKNSQKTPILLRLIFFLNIILGIGMLGAYVGTHISPNRIPYIYYLGLGYPILLTLTLVFILFWLIFKRKYIWFNLVVILIGWNHLNDFYAFNVGDYAPSANSIKVMSYNVKIFSLYDLENRVENRDKIFRFIQKENPDVICFQEFYHQEGSSNFVTKDLLINQVELPYYQERYTHEMRGEKYFGVATFSKYPIFYQGEIAFENDPNNFCIYSDILKGRDTIRVYNAHIGSIRFQDKDYEFFGENGEGVYPKQKDGRRILGRLKFAYEKRAIQIEKITKNVENSPYKVVFCGDLNDTPVSYCYNRLENLLIDGFTESGNGIGTTYVGKIPSNRIDYIFHSEELTGTAFTTYELDYSDHKPISCAINL